MMKGVKNCAVLREVLRIFEKQFDNTVYFVLILYFNTV